MAAAGSRFARPRAAVIDTVETAARAPSANIIHHLPPTQRAPRPPPTVRVSSPAAEGASVIPTANISLLAHISPAADLFCQPSATDRRRAQPPLARLSEHAALPVRRFEAESARAARGAHAPRRRATPSKRSIDRSAARTLQHGRARVRRDDALRSDGGRARARWRICSERGTACAPLTAADRLTSVALYV